MPILPNYPMVNKGNRYINGLATAFVDSTHFTVGAGQARDSTNINDINLLAPVSLNSAIQGANGIDQGTIANSTLYYIFVIGDSTSNDTSLEAAAVQPVPPIQPPVTVTESTGGYFKPGAALISLSPTAPALPTGYDMFRLIGTVETSNVGAFLSFSSFSANPSVNVTINAGISVLAAGNATAFTAVPVTLHVPVGASSVRVLAALTSDAGGTRTASFRATGSGSVAGSVIMSSPASTVTSTTLTIPVSTIAGVVSFDYLVSNASAALTLTLVGYTLPV